MNKAFEIGNLTRDPDSRTTKDGKQVCSFTIAVNRPRKVEGQPDADFFRVVAFNNLADTCSRYLAKGRKVCAVGPVSVSTYQTQNGETKAQMEIMAQEVHFLTPASETPQKAPETQKTDRQTGFTQVDAEPLPF